MKKINDSTNSERQYLEIQKERHIASISLLALIVIMILYYLFG